MSMYIPSSKLPYSSGKWSEFIFILFMLANCQGDKQNDSFSQSQRNNFM